MQTTNSLTKPRSKKKKLCFFVFVLQRQENLKQMSSFLKQKGEKKKNKTRPKMNYGQPQTVGSY
jgi:hypothetical protein